MAERVNEQTPAEALAKARWERELDPDHPWHVAWDDVSPRVRQEQIEFAEADVALLDAAGFRVSSKPDDDTRREAEGLKPWCFIAEGDERQINYAAHEDHDYAVLIGDNHWWCAGCLSKPPRRFTEDGYSMWPNLVAAPNGLRLVIEPVVDGMNVARRPLCPRSLAEEVRSDG